ncbi:MAG: hypothetical protein Q4A82_06190 [Corynebacterium sp.]|nr:hypothetical protein [Corynebacterium sp.]
MDQQRYVPNCPTQLTKTERVYYRAVSRDGKVQPGFTVKQNSRAAAVICSSDLRLSEDDGIVQCGPTFESYPVCYKTTERGALWVYCARDPEVRELYKYPLAEVTKSFTASKARPWKIELEDGTKCTVRQGGAGGTATDGRISTYNCTGTTKKHVVSLPRDMGSTGIKTTGAVWYAQMGEVGNPGDKLPDVEGVAIKKAYFAAYAN